MKLSEYLYKLATDKTAVVNDRILYLYDTEHNAYFTKVIHPAHIDPDGIIYKFFDDDEPFHDYEKLNVVKAWTIDDVVNCIMGVLVIEKRYCESEV